MVLEIMLGDVIRTRKPHPCGGDQWIVVRLGADIGIRCLKCHHRVLIPRPTVERQIKRFVSRRQTGEEMTKKQETNPGHL